MATPTLAQIRSQIITDIEGQTGQTTPIFSRAWTRVLAWALSGPLALLYALIAWAQRQIHPTTCNRAGLLYWGQRYAIYPKDAHAALLGVTLSGVDTTLCPAGTLWTSAANGLVYSQIAGVTIVGTTAAAQVRCLTQSAAGTLSAGAALTLPSPVPGITGAVVASIIEAGVDVEDTEDLRVRILERMRYQSIVGTAAGYIAQALECEGIVEAHAKRVAGASDIVVYPLKATTGSARVPSAGELATVQNYLQAVSRRLLCVTIYAQAAVERTVAITITGVSPADAAIKATIAAAINVYLYSVYPLQYGDEINPNNIVDIGHIWQIILAAGATATLVAINISGIGGGPYTVPVGEIVAPGALTWA